MQIVLGRIFDTVSALLRSSLTVAQSLPLYNISRFVFVVAFWTLVVLAAIVGAFCL